MVITGCPARNKGVVWRGIAGEVVIAENDVSTVRVLNGTASLIWTLADGSRHIEDMVTDVCNRFEVTPEQARADVEEFCSQLLEAGLVTLKDVSRIT